MNDFDFSMGSAKDNQQNTSQMSGGKGGMVDFPLATTSNDNSMDHNQSKEPHNNSSHNDLIGSAFNEPPK